MNSVFSSVIASDPDLLHIIFEALPEPTFLINREGYYVEAWGGTDTKRHHNPKQLVGLHQSEVLPPKLAKLHSQLIKDIIKSGLPREIEYDLDPKKMPALKDSSQGPLEKQYFSALVIPIKGTDLVLWLVRNMTEYKKTVAKLALHQSELEHLTNLDHLTQMYNRYAMDALLPNALNAAKQHHLSAAIFMIDIDCFKEYNDHHGHQRGDSVLRQVSKAIADWKRKSDLCFRYGGDEFLIFISDIDIKSCKHKAEQLVKSVSDLKIANPHSPVCPYLSITIGLNHYPMIPSDMTVNEFVKIADNALMYGKNHQRGSVHILNELSDD